MKENILNLIINEDLGHDLIEKNVMWSHKFQRWRM